MVRRASDSVGLDLLADCPDKARELARDRHHDLVAVDAARAEPTKPRARRDGGVTRTQPSVMSVRVSARETANGRQWLLQEVLRRLCYGEQVPTDVSTPW